MVTSWWLNLDASMSEIRQIHDWIRLRNIFMRDISHRKLAQYVMRTRDSGAKTTNE